MASLIDEQARLVAAQEGPGPFLLALMEAYAEDDGEAWRRLAMLALREQVSWPLSNIAVAFGHSRGHVKRLMDQTKRELRAKVPAKEPPPDETLTEECPPTPPTETL